MYYSTLAVSIWGGIYSRNGSAMMTAL